MSLIKKAKSIGLLGGIWGAASALLGTALEIASGVRSGSTLDQMIRAFWADLPIWGGLGFVAGVGFGLYLALGSAKRRGQFDVRALVGASTISFSMFVLGIAALIGPRSFLDRISSPEVVLFFALFAALFAVVGTVLKRVYDRPSELEPAQLESPNDLHDFGIGRAVPEPVRRKGAGSNL